MVQFLNVECSCLSKLLLKFLTFTQKGKRFVEMSLFKPLYGKEVLVNAALWVAERLPEEQRRLHKVFKTLWFADLSHLKKYGRTITGDTYIAMKNGPVPSILYDETKDPNSEFFKRFDKGSEKGFLSLLKKADENYLSETDKEELLSSLETYKDVEFSNLTEESHKSAWRSAGLNNSIRINEILDEIGADAELRQYVLDYDALRRVV